MSTFEITCTTIIQTKNTYSYCCYHIILSPNATLTLHLFKTSTTSDPQPPTPISKTKGKFKEDPSPLHRPRKDNIKIDLMPINYSPNLKKNTKNTSVKNAREQDSPNETTPVSKISETENFLKSRMPWRQTLILLTRITSQFAQQITSLVSWNCRGYRSHTDDVKDIIRQYHPVYVALQETFLKSCHTTKIRRYGCVRKDTEGPSVSGGVCIFTSLDVPSSALPLHTSLQAVAVRIHSTSLITVCCLYLPPNTVIHQHDLNNLVDQLPAPLSYLVTSMDIALCGNLYNSDHFPVILSHDSDPAGKTFPPTYSYRRADWALFTQLAVITDAMVKAESIDTTVQEVTNVLIAAADLSIPKSSGHSFKHYKPWWNADCQTAYKNQRKLWGIFRRYPTTENLLAFKKAKANARRSLEGALLSLQLEEATVIPILKPGKVATDPLSYRPIALTSCFCKTFERMVNTRLVYVLEKEKCISPLQSGPSGGSPSLVKCPPLQILKPLLSVPHPNASPSITSNSTSSSTTQANLLPSASSIKPTTQTESRFPEPISSAAAPDNSLITPASSLSTETRPLKTSNKFAALSTEIQSLVPQVHLLPSTSTVATVSEPQPPNPTSNDTPSITYTHQMKTMFTHPYQRKHVLLLKLQPL
ncbi:putative RNA-directed DNA polymerase from transposon X-element [Trichonephila clavipes]|nr:putative RNA-directed DNA polymerase from transposon X-element [Trichonephila clavipes]